MPWSSNILASASSSKYHMIVSPVWMGKRPFFTVILPPIIRVSAVSPFMGSASASDMTMPAKYSSDGKYAWPLTTQDVAQCAMRSSLLRQS